MCILCCIKNEMACNLIQNSEILLNFTVPPSWKLRHTAILLFQESLGCIPIQASEQKLQLKCELSLFSQQNAGHFSGNFEISKELV